jgi:hypothetical protein
MHRTNRITVAQGKKHKSLTVRLLAIRREVMQKNESTITTWLQGGTGILAVVVGILQLFDKRKWKKK